MIIIFIRHFSAEFSDIHKPMLLKKNFDKTIDTSKSNSVCMVSAGQCLKLSLARALVHMNHRNNRCRVDWKSFFPLIILTPFWHEECKKEKIDCYLRYRRKTYTKDALVNYAFVRWSIFLLLFTVCAYYSVIMFYYIDPMLLTTFNSRKNIL